MSGGVQELCGRLQSLLPQAEQELRDHVVESLRGCLLAAQRMSDQVHSALALP